MQNVKKKNTHRYWMSVTFLLLLALVMGAVSLGTAMQIKGLDWFSGLVDARAYDLIFVAATAGVITLLAAIVYLMNLRPYQLRRPLGLVFLNFMAPCLYGALGLAAYDRGGSDLFTVMTMAGAPALALAPPLLLLGLETLVWRILRGIGRMAHDRKWSSMAIFFMKMALAFHPADRETRLACGLLYVADDECEQGLRLLEPIAQAESGNEKYLKALEHCYRTQGQGREALQVLQQMNRLKPGQVALERRILDDFVRLEMHREALDLLETGHLKMTVELLQLAEKLNLALGNYAQAMALIRQIAGEESRPHNLAIRLYRELIKSE
jgi:tetratricopeptide (TPR) repeat protein